MRKICLILTILLALLPVAAKEKGTLRFVSKTHDFGFVKEKGGNVTCRFEFRNEGDEPVIILNANASCGCAHPSYPKKPIRPNETGAISVTYAPAGRPGPFDKAVTVRTNCGVVHLRIKGNVIP